MPAVENRKKRLDKIKKLNSKYDPDESSMGLIAPVSGPLIMDRPPASPINRGRNGNKPSKLKGAVIKYPIVKTRKPPTIEFDSTSYKNLLQLLWRQTHTIK